MLLQQRRLGVESIRIRCKQLGKIGLLLLLLRLLLLRVGCMLLGIQMM